MNKILFIFLLLFTNTAIAEEYPIEDVWHETNTFGSESNCLIKLNHKVIWNKEENCYFYYYKIDYKTTEDFVIFSWEVMDYNIPFKMPMLIILRQNCKDMSTGKFANKILLFKRTEKPVYSQTRASIYMDSGNDVYDSALIIGNARGSTYEQR